MDLKGYLDLFVGYGAKITEVNDFVAAAHANMSHRYEEKIQKLEEENKKLLEALIWCGGSRDFSETGIARQGWITICKPLIFKD